MILGLRNAAVLTQQSKICGRSGKRGIGNGHQDPSPHVQGSKHPLLGVGRHGHQSLLGIFYKPCMGSLPKLHDHGPDSHETDDAAPIFFWGNKIAISTDCAREFWARSSLGREAASCHVSREARVGVHDSEARCRVTFQVTCTRKKSPQNGQRRSSFLYQ